jgi:hypothetical protein
VGMHLSIIKRAEHGKSHRPILIGAFLSHTPSHLGNPETKFGMLNATDCYPYGMHSSSRVL